MTLNHRKNPLQTIDKTSICSICDDDDDQSSGVSIQSNHDSHIIERDESRVVEADASRNDQTQDILVDKNGTIWQKTTTSYWNMSYA